MAIKTLPKINCAQCTYRQKSLFAALKDGEVDSVSAAKSCTNYKKGQVLFHEGTRPLGVFCVYNGKIKIYKLGTDGKEQIIRLAKESDILGFKAMLSEETYPVTAETLEDCTICFVPKADFMQLLSDNSEFNQSLMKSICQEIGTLTDKVTNRAKKSVRERLAISLLMLREIYKNEDDGQAGPVEINLSREDLANIVGTATETLIRLLHDFKEEKLITGKGRKITIENPQGLAKVGRI